jgi:hypothetical protein
MLTNLVRVKILTDALASVASVWVRAWQQLNSLMKSTSVVVSASPAPRIGRILLSESYAELVEAITRLNNNALF